MWRRRLAGERTAEGGGSTQELFRTAPHGPGAYPQSMKSSAPGYGIWIVGVLSQKTENRKLFRTVAQEPSKGDFL
jgi:hypothetical protein